MATQASDKAKTNGKKGGVESPRPLSTVTDLKPEEVEKVVGAINPIVADSIALYLKTKNFHWHLSGSHFRDYHLLLDEHADAIFATIDPLAERVRKIGGTTVRSVSNVSQLQTIADDNDPYVPPGEMMRRLMEDNRHVAASMRAAHEVCDDSRDYATASLLENFIDETERRTWFLYEIVQGLDNSN